MYIYRWSFPLQKERRKDKEKQEKKKKEGDMSLQINQYTHAHAHISTCIELMHIHVHGVQVYTDMGTCISTMYCIYFVRMANPEIAKNRSKLVLPAPQISDTELEEVLYIVQCIYMYTSIPIAYMLPVHITCIYKHV